MAQIRKDKKKEKGFCFVEKENDFDFIFVEKENSARSSCSSDGSDYYTEELSAAQKGQGSDDFVFCDNDILSATGENMRLKEEFLRERLVKLCSTVKCLELHLVKWSHKTKQKCPSCSESLKGCLSDMRDLISKLKYDLTLSAVPDPPPRREDVVSHAPVRCNVSTQTDFRSFEDPGKDEVIRNLGKRDAFAQTDFRTYFDRRTKELIIPISILLDVAAQMDLESLDALNDKEGKGRTSDSDTVAKENGGESVSENENEEISDESSHRGSFSCEDSSDGGDSDNEDSSCEDSSDEESSDESDNDTVASGTDSSVCESDRAQKHPKTIPVSFKPENSEKSFPRDNKIPKYEKRKENSTNDKKASSRKRGYDTMRKRIEYYKSRVGCMERLINDDVRDINEWNESVAFLTRCEIAVRGKQSEETARIIKDMVIKYIDKHQKMDLGCFTDPEDYETDPDAPPTDSEDDSNEDSSDDEVKSLDEDSGDEVNELQEASLQLDENNKYLEQEIQLMQNQDLKLSTRLDYEKHYKFYEDLRNEMISTKFYVKYSRETTEAHEDRIWKTSYQYGDVAEWLFLANNLLNPASPHRLDAKLKESEAQVLKSEIWLGRLKEKLAMAEYRLKVLEEECKTRNREIIRRIAQVDRQIRRVGRAMWQVFDVICNAMRKSPSRYSRFEIEQFMQVEKKRSDYLNKLLIWLEQEKERLLDMRRRFRNKLRESDGVAVFIEQEKSQLEAQKKDLARRAANFTESRKDMEDIRADFEGYVSELEELDTESSSDSDY